MYETIYETIFFALFSRCARKIMILIAVLIDIFHVYELRVVNFGVS